MRKTLSLVSRSKAVFWTKIEQNIELTVLTENCVIVSNILLGDFAPE